MSEPRHPLLALKPQARRHLARALVEGLEAQRRAERDVRSRHGLLSGAACAVTGAGLGLGWQAFAAGELGPFLVWYGLWLGIQAGVGKQLAGREAPWASPMLQWAVMAPYEAATALKGWAFPRRVPADRLVLAAGLLVAIRRPVARQLVRRLVGRAYAQAEVDQAIALLLQMRLLETGFGEATGVLRLTRDGAHLLKALGVAQSAPRVRRDAAIAQHLVPLFTLLDSRGGRVREVALPQLSRPAPAIEPPAIDWQPDSEALDEVEPPPRRARVLPAKPAIAAAAAVCAGVLAFAIWSRLPAAVPPHALLVSATSMPHSRGTALQFNGRGLMLSSFSGELFLSIPERLDYKRPLTFKGFDMATDCGLHSRKLEHVSMSPHGRFLLAEMGGGADGPRERCLVDLETKTVTHDLVAQHAIFGLPGLVGWAGEDRLVLSEAPVPRQADRWWVVTVTSGEKQPLALPRHARLMPLPVETGSMQVLGLDMHQRGVWDLTTYWLDTGKAYRKLRTVRATFPEALKEAEPLHAALSPDKRFVLMALRPLGLSGADRPGALAVVELADGQTVAVEPNAAPLPDQPIFWGPEVRGGTYRFYFNSPNETGVSPWTGELKVAERP